MRGYKGELAAELGKYQALAHLQGTQNLPSTDAPSLDQHESKLEAEAKRFVLSEHSAFCSKVNELNKQTAAVEQSLVAIKSKCDTLLNDASLPGEIIQHLAAEQHSLVGLRTLELKLRADLNGFKVKNGITSQAHYPSDLVLHLSWIFMSMAIETVINAFFFENQNGLLGGAIVALAISIVNLSLAGIFGYFFCYKNHHDKAEQIFGWMCLALFFLVTIYLNAVFSTFRYEYQLVADPSDFKQTATAFNSALNRAITLFYFRIPFNDILSFVLFFIGCLLSGYAFYKGYTFDDRYPGYGSRDRRHNTSAQNVLDAETAVRGRIRAILYNRRSELVSLGTTLSTDGLRIIKLERSLIELRGEFNAVLQRIQSEFALVSDAYRRSNRAVRNTPPPSYFLTTPDIRGDYADGMAEPVRVRISELNSQFEQMRSAYLDRISTEIQELSSHSTQILGAEFNRFVNEVLLQANAKMAEEMHIIRKLTSGKV